MGRTKKIFVLVIIEKSSKTTFGFSVLFGLFIIMVAFSVKTGFVVFLPFVIGLQNYYDIEGASKLLEWEKLRDASRRPVLNLSARDASPEESSTPISDNKESWCNGQLWKQTKDGLNELGVNIDDSFYLQQCPQLLRLDPSVVLQTASFLIDQFDIEYLEKEPKLLGYQANDAKYGLEFMSTMMMRDAKSQCLASTDFYLNAIDLGIQEQVVKAALGAAGDATSKANQRIVGDTMVSLNNLKQKKGLS